MTAEENNTAEPSLRRRAGLFFLVFAAYAALTIVMTWPIAGRLGVAIPGSAGDAWVHLFAFRAIRDALLSGQWPPYSDMIFYPQGVSLIYHNLAYFHALLWLPLQAVMSEATAYSLVFMATFAFNGLAVFLFVRDETRSNAAAFLAGLIGAFWPYILGHHHHPNLNLIAWVPLALIFLRRTLLRQRISDAIIAGVMVALIGISRWQMLVLGGVLIGLYYIYYLATHRAAWGRRIFALTLLIGAVALVLMLPLMWPLLESQLNSPDLEGLLSSSSFRTDPLAYLLPNRYHPLWGDFAYDHLYRACDICADFPATIGYTTMALAAYGIIRQWRKARFWFMAAIIYVVLALGPELFVSDQLLIPLPYRWLEKLFIFSAVRHPDRFNAILVIPVAALAAYGYMSLSRSQRLRNLFGRWHPRALLIILAALILFEYVSEYRMLWLGAPAWFEELAQEEGDFAILNLPYDPFVDKHFMAQQMVHGKAIVGGKIARPPAEALAFADELPLLQNFPADLSPPTEVEDVGQQLRFLAQNNIRYIIIHKIYFDKEQLAAWRSWLMVTPIHDDGELTVYATDYDVRRDTTFRNTAVAGLGIANITTSPESTTQDGWVQVTVDWVTTDPIGETIEACINLADRRGQAYPPDCQPLSAFDSDGRLAANEMFHNNYLLNMDPFLESGVYDIQLSLLRQGQDVPIGQPFLAGSVEFKALPRTLTTIDPAVVEANPRWGDALTLVDYDVTPGADGFQVALQWLTLRRMDTSYKVFLHLFDEDSGDLISQIDAAPQNWSYPTNWWEKGELVEDTYFLPLEDGTTGRYTLWVGVYDAADGQRPPLTVPVDDADRVNQDAYRLFP
ncbi:MAG: hypothetical protein PVH65_09340 [Chloroflexota bacterium]|jgi:hypothetical protein